MRGGRARPGKGRRARALWRREDTLGWHIDLPPSTPYPVANGSSIAVVASYKGKTVLCAAEAHSELLEESSTGWGPRAFTAVKLWHRGSRANLSPLLLERIRSQHWRISTNGARFENPDLEATARIVTTQGRPVFHLNYVTPQVEDLIGGSGERCTVRLPRRRRNGEYETGLVVELA